MYLSIGYRRLYTLSKGVEIDRFKKSENKFVIVNNNTHIWHMNKSLIDLARSSGFKVNFLAVKIGVKPNYLAMCLRKERNLSEDKCRKLKDFLEAIPA